MSVARVVLYSGGVGSFCAALGVREEHGTEDLILLFTDTRIEDEDTYRFLRDGAAVLGGRLVEISDGRTPWEVFRDVRMLGNSRVDPCSKLLKRDLGRRWLKEHQDPASAVIYVGVDWMEEHRFDRMRERWLPWRIEAPLVQPPYLNKEQMHQVAEAMGLPRQRLYRMGAGHANCGGGCVKMGIGGFARLLRSFPARYLEWEREESRLREVLGDVAILRDRRGGQTTPLPLSQLRERLSEGEECDLFEIGGCGCMVDDGDER